MPYKYDSSIHLNEFGEPDLDYYVARAHKMRGEALVAGFRAFKAWLMKTLDRAWFPDEGHSEPRRRVIQSDWPWVDLILQGHANQKAGHV